MKVDLLMNGLRAVQVLAPSDLYMTVPQAAKSLGVSVTRVQQLVAARRFEGAGKVGDTWLIPRQSVAEFSLRAPGRPGKGEMS